MALQFVGDIGIYFPDRDAIKITALAGDEPIDCFALRSALAEIGCRPGDPLHTLVDRFQQRRDVIELAAMVKYRRAVQRPSVLAIAREDVQPLAWI